MVSAKNGTEASYIWSQQQRRMARQRANVHTTHRTDHCVSRLYVTRVYTTSVTMLGAYLRGLLLVHILCFQHPRSLRTHMNGRVTFQQKREDGVGTMHMLCTLHHRGASSSSSTDPRRRQTPANRHSSQSNTTVKPHEYVDA